MKKMVLFLAVGVAAAFLNYRGHQGLLIEAGALFGLIGIVMAVGKVKPLWDRLKERLKKVKEKKEAEED